MIFQSRAALSQAPLFALLSETSFLSAGPVCQRKTPALWKSARVSRRCYALSMVFTKGILLVSIDTTTLLQAVMKNTDALSKLSCPREGKDEVW